MLQCGMGEAKGVGRKLIGSRVARFHDRDGRQTCPSPLVCEWNGASWPSVPVADRVLTLKRTRGNARAPAILIALNL